VNKAYKKIEKNTHFLGNHSNAIALLPDTPISTPFTKDNIFKNIQTKHVHKTLSEGIKKQ